ncbi:unnamed protein product, partial [Symbiodinium microadriaticum]
LRQERHRRGNPQGLPATLAGRWCGPAQREGRGEHFQVRKRRPGGVKQAGGDARLYGRAPRHRQGGDHWWPRATSSVPTGPEDIGGQHGLWPRRAEPVQRRPGDSDECQRGRPVHHPRGELRCADHCGTRRHAAYPRGQLG